MNRPFNRKSLCLYGVLFFLFIFSCGSDTTGTNPPTVTNTPGTQYTVTFDLNEGTGNIPAQDIVSGGMATKPTDPTRTGYNFVGWFKNVGGTGTVVNLDTETITADITLYAKWTAKTPEETPQNVSLIIDTIKTTKKVDLFNIEAALYDRKGTKIKEKEGALPYSKIFLSANEVIEKYKNEKGYDAIFANDILLGGSVSGLDYGFNVNDKGEPYLLFAIDNKIYLDDDHYIQLSYVRRETYMKKDDNSIWQIPTSSRLFWNLEIASSQPNTLNGYAGYKFTNFPESTTHLDRSIKIKCQVTGDYVTGNSYTLQLTLRQKLVSSTEEILLENYVVTKTFTTKAGSGSERYTTFPPDIFFQESKTEFAR